MFRGGCTFGSMVDKHRVDGVAKKIRGSIKEAVGKITGDIKTEAEGKAEKDAGIVHDEADTTERKVRDDIKK